VCGHEEALGSAAMCRKQTDGASGWQASSELANRLQHPTEKEKPWA